MKGMLPKYLFQQENLKKKALASQCYVSYITKQFVRFIFLDKEWEYKAMS